MHQQIAGVDELGVLGLGQDSLSGYFRLLGHYPPTMRSNISDLHMSDIIFIFVNLLRIK